MRWSICLLFLSMVQPVAAREVPPPYYGPEQGLFKGGGGYRDKQLKDGSWRVDASTQGDHALDMAMYRAAELARDQGHAYVQFLGGMGHRFQIGYSATVWIRPSDDPSPPTNCQSKRPGSCYTADAAELLRVLGGPDGTQPGIPITDHRDEYGRAVSISGFGIAPATRSGSANVVPAPLRPIAATVARGAAVAVPSLTSIGLRVPAIPNARTTAPLDDEASLYQKRQKAEQGVHGREPNQGWIISD